MCGIVGVAGNLKSEHYEIFKTLLLLDVVRGLDSTSVLQVDKGFNGYEIARCSGHPANLWKDWNKQGNLFSSDGCVGFSSRVLLGHNRHTTSGDANVENPHPFDFDNVVGVHNGTLYSTYGLHDEHKYDIDSEALYSDLSHNGIDHTWGELAGAAALAYWEPDQDKLNFIRNDERTLYILKDKDVIYWASEPWMLEVAINRARFVKWPTKVDGEGKVVNIKPLLLTTNHLYSFEIPHAEAGKDVVIKEETPERKKPLWGGGVTNYGTGYNVVYSSSKNVPEKSKPKGPINFNWAGNYKKAGKDMRGRKVQLNFCYDTPHKGGTQYMIVARYTHNQEKIYIYPDTFAEYEYYKNMSFGINTNEKTYATIDARPRILSDKEDHSLLSKTKTVYGVSIKNITLLQDESVEVIDPNDRYEKEIDNFFDGLGEKTAMQIHQEQLKDAGQCCHYCDDPLPLSDPESTFWADRFTPCCEACWTDLPLYGVH